MIIIIMIMIIIIIIIPVISTKIFPLTLTFCSLFKIIIAAIIAGPMEVKGHNKTTGVTGTTRSSFQTLMHIFHSLPSLQKQVCQLLSSTLEPMCTTVSCQITQQLTYENPFFVVLVFYSKYDHILNCGV